MRRRCREFRSEFRVRDILLTKLVIHGTITWRSYGCTTWRERVRRPVELPVQR